MITDDDAPHTLQLCGYCASNSPLRNYTMRRYALSMNHTRKALRQFITAFVAILCAGTAPSALGKAYYAAEEEMIERAEVIAIVNVTRVEKAKTKGTHWTYNEVALATVEETLKGTPPQTVKLYGGEDFLCAQVHFVVGRYIVFLRRDGELLVGCNWDFSVRPIKDKQAEWYVAGERMTLSWQPLDAVLERIKNPVVKPKSK